MAVELGGPMYCLMSARSTNAKSIAPVMLDVVSIRQFGNLHQRNHASFNTSGHYMTPQYASGKNSNMEIKCFYESSEAMCLTLSLPAVYTWKPEVQKHTAAQNWLCYIAGHYLPTLNCCIYSTTDLILFIHTSI